VAKELKAVDKKKLDRVNKLLKTNIASDKVIRFIMSVLSQLLNENENATVLDLEKHMENVEQFHESVRKCDTSANSKEWLTETMKSITGDNQEGGDIVKRLVNPLNSRMYLEFFALFKLVSKMCYLGGAIRKIKLQQRKVAASEKSVADK